MSGPRRLTLEYWLTPRLDRAGITRWPGTEVAEVVPGEEGSLRVTLSNAARLTVDRVVFASGYRADLARVGYLAGVLDGVEVRNGFPVLDNARRGDARQPPVPRGRPGIILARR